MPTPKKGYFLKDGTKVPGVTTILGKFKDPGALMYWAWNVAHEGLEPALFLLEGWWKGEGNKEATERLLTTPRDHWHYRKRSGMAAEIGTVVHAMVELHLTGRRAEDALVALTGNPESISKAETCFLGFLQWAEQNKLKVLRTELALVSERHRYGGTLDACVLSINGRTCIGDWKTSNAIYADHLIQVGGGYRPLYIENFPDEKVDAGAYIFRFAKDSGDFHVHHFEDVTGAAEAFLPMRALYDLTKELHKRFA